MNDKNTMDPTDFLKAVTSHHSSIRTLETEEATQQSSFSCSDGSMFGGGSASAGLDFDLHMVDSNNNNATGHQRQTYADYCAQDGMNESNDSLMFEESFALGESFSCADAGEGPSSLLMGELGIPSPRRMPRERPDLSTVIDIEEDEEEMDDENNKHNAEMFATPLTLLKPQTSNISVKAKQG